MRLSDLNAFWWALLSKRLPARGLSASALNNFEEAPALLDDWLRVHEGTHEQAVDALIGYALDAADRRRRRAALKGDEA